LRPWLPFDRTAALLETGHPAVAAISSSLLAAIATQL
jgi:hypothetical protein